MRPGVRATTLGFVGSLLLMWSVAGCAERLSRRFSGRVMMPHRAYITTPASLSLPYVDVRFRSRTGQLLRGWFLPSDGSSAGVVVLNGNTGNMSYHLLYARILWSAGFNVLLFDYQGFGRSGGRLSLLSLADDARAALDFLRAQPEVDPRLVGLFGISLGSVVALAVAAQSPGVAAVAAESSYEPQRQLGRMLVRRRNYRPWTARLAARLIAGFGFPAHFRPLDNVERLNGVPLFLLHGADDDFLPATTSLRLFLKHTGPTQLWLPERTGHSPELLVTQDGEYQAQLVGFFRQWLRLGVSRQVRGLPWQVRHHRDGSFEVRIHPGNLSSQPTPLEIITIRRGGSGFSRHRVWAQGSQPIVLRPEQVPAAVAVTPRYGRVERHHGSWRPIPTLYTRSYRRLQAAWPRFRRLLRQGAHGLAAAGRLLDRLYRLAWDLRIRPDLGRMYAWYGARLHRRARYADALLAYERALALAPVLPRQYYTLGAARFSYGAPAYLKWTRRRVRALRARLKPSP